MARTDDTCWQRCLPFSQLAQSLQLWLLMALFQNTLVMRLCPPVGQARHHVARKAQIWDGNCLRYKTSGSADLIRRYTMITLGAFTLFIFICRFVIFTFRESPKFLLAKGHDAHALDVLYSIAKFNRVEQPKLSMDDFNALDFEAHSTESRLSTSSSRASSHAGLMASGRNDNNNVPAMSVVAGFFHNTFSHLKRLFAVKVYAYVFVVLAIA